MRAFTPKTTKGNKSFLYASAKDKNSGVTLIEMLIAISIFSTILVQATIYFRNTSRNNKVLNSKQDALDLVQESLDSLEQNFRKREAIVSVDKKSVTLLVKAKEVTFESSCRAASPDKTKAIFLSLCTTCGCVACSGQHVITRTKDAKTRDYPPIDEKGLERVRGAVICFSDNAKRLTATVSAAYAGLDGKLVRVTDERSLSKKKLNTGIQFR